MIPQYSFVTDWYIKSPLSSVWDAIYFSEEWPSWWTAVISVTEIKKGDERGIGSVRIYKLRSPLYYTLSFNLRVTHRIDHQFLKGHASGELEGTGAWKFEEQNGITHIQCRWDVITTIKWMNRFAFILKPIFAFNHKLVMQNGAKCLAKKLNAELISF